MTATPFTPFAPENDAPDVFIGTSPSFRQLVRMIDRVAPTDHALLIFGPTGSGKELVARRVHARSLHHDRPFVDVNCGAIPENLVEAELFGHVKGAFTGAGENRQGLFQQVGNGTLLLDEIGELPLALQPKLLRVLETRTFRPIGALFHSFKTWRHGELLLRAGRPDACEAILATALDEVLARQERVYLGELLIVRARAQWALGDLVVAEQGLRTALSTALALGSVPARVDAARYLADLLRHTGRRVEAIETLERGLRALPPDPLPRLADALNQLAALRNDVSTTPSRKGLANEL